MKRAFERRYGLAASIGRTPGAKVAQFGMKQIRARVSPL